MTERKKMTLEERSIIEFGILKEKSLKEISRDIGMNRSSVSREIFKNRTHIEGSYYFNNDCLHAKDCMKIHLCGNMDCPFPCKTCRKKCLIGGCGKYCSNYTPMTCALLVAPPYVCNNCQYKADCNKEHYLYIAREADKNAGKVRSESRKGPHLSKNELRDLDNLISPLIIIKNQSLAHICASISNLPVSERTLYRYIEECLLTARNIHLPRKVGYRERGSTDNKENEPIKDKAYKKDRTYDNFEAFTKQYGESNVVEMDTVISGQHCRKRLLTIFHREYSFLFIFLIPNGKAESVKRVFDMLEEKLGLYTFTTLFSIVLTDNGGEFQQVKGLEFNDCGDYRCNVFYCNPMSSWQKGAIEKSHEIIRYILPKGSTFEPLTQEDCNLMMNHINSLKRDKLGNKSPFEIVRKNDEAFKKVLDCLGRHPIPAKDVHLKPSLLKNKCK